MKKSKTIGIISLIMMSVLVFASCDKRGIVNQQLKYFSTHYNFLLNIKNYFNNIILKSQLHHFILFC